MPRSAEMLLTRVSAGSVSFVAITRKPAKSNMVRLPREQPVLNKEIFLPAKSNMVRLPPISRYRPTVAVTGTTNLTNEAHRVERLPATASSRSDSLRKSENAFFSASKPLPVRW